MPQFVIWFFLLLFFLTQRLLQVIFYFPTCSYSSSLISRLHLFSWSTTFHSSLLCNCWISTRFQEPFTHYKNSQAYLSHWTLSLTHTRALSFSFSRRLFGSFKHSVSLIMTPCLCKFLLGPSTANNVRRAFRFLEQWEEKKSFCNCMFIGDLPYGWGSCTHTHTRTHICTWRRGSVVYQRITHAYPATMMSETLYRFCLAILTWVLTMLATTTSSTTTTISTTSAAAALLWMNQQQLCDGERVNLKTKEGEKCIGWIILALHMTF